MYQEETQVSITLEEDIEVTSVLQEEAQFFSDNFEKLLDRYVGKLVLIKGSRLVGVFESQRAALKEGARMFGLEPFLIRRVGREMDELCFRVPFGAALPDVCACARCSGGQFSALLQACA